MYFSINYLPSKDKEKVTETKTTASACTEKIDFKPVPIIAAIIAMGITAFGLHFIKQIGLAQTDSPSDFLRHLLHG